MKRYRVIGQKLTVTKGTKLKTTDGKAITTGTILSEGDEFKTDGDMTGRAVREVESDAEPVA